MNARFWTYAHGADVKLTLRPGQTLEWVECSGDDCEPSTSWQRFHHDGHGVVSIEENDCRSCDGRLTSLVRSFAPLSRLRDVLPIPDYDFDEDHWSYRSRVYDARDKSDVRYPRWRLLDSKRR